MRFSAWVLAFALLLNVRSAEGLYTGLADIEVVGPGGTPADLVGERPAVLYITTPRVEDVPQRMPLLKFLYDELGGAVNVGMVIYGEDPKNLVKFREGMPYPIYAARGAIPPELLGDGAVPLTLFFDALGRLLERRSRTGVPDALDASAVLEASYNPGPSGPPADDELIPELVLIGTDEKYHDFRVYGTAGKKTLVYIMAVEDEDRERRLTRLQYLQDDLGDRLTVVPVLLGGSPAAALKLADAYVLDVPLLTGGPLARHRLAGSVQLPVLVLFDRSGRATGFRAASDVPDRNEIAAEESQPAEEGPPVPLEIKYTVKLVSGLVGTVVPVSTWTADGRTVIFNGRFDGDQHDKLYAITSYGKGLRKLTTAKAHDVHPTASPAGRYVFFTSTRTGDEELWRFYVDRGQFTRITKFKDRAVAPSFSNDGGLVIFQRPAAGGFDLWVATPEGRRERPVDETFFDERNGRIWGDRVYYESNRYGNADIFSCDLMGGKRRRLTADEAADVMPAISPDGRYVVWATDRRGDFDLWVMNGDGSSKKPLTSGRGDDLYPAFSPDGREISFTRVSGPVAEIFKLTFEGLPDYDGLRGPRPLVTKATP